jgi:hypothetical protein
MYESFELLVIYKREELLFLAHLQQRGFTHSIVIDVYGTEVIFELDE